MQGLVMNFELDIHVHKIGGCYVLKVNLFHRKKVFLIKYF